MKRRLMQTAWAISAHFATFADALRRAWQIVKLAAKMKRGVVSFSYFKKDGSTRKAMGTLTNTPAIKSEREANYNVFTYFDTEVNAWRSACTHNLIF